MPTTTSVAMKLIDLGKDAHAGPAEYAAIICADSALTSKLLSLANSAWFGLRNQVTRPHLAINLLGLSTVRTLAITYCISGLHNSLGLSPDESRTFWTASLAKAVAARCYAESLDPQVSDEAFTAGLLQDFAQPILYSIARDQVLEWLADARLDCQARLAREREVFQTDHAEIGRLVAEKMNLPDLYVDAIACHHNHKRLRECLASPALADAVCVASLFPHCLSAWNPRDAEMFHALLCRTPPTLDPVRFGETVSKELALLHARFALSGDEHIDLDELLVAASREAADCTTRLVGAMHEMTQQAERADQQFNQMIKEHSRLEEAARRDALTGALNREGLASRAPAILKKAGCYGNGLAIVYLDLDHFKMINDTCGHMSGDAVLKKVVELLRKQIRETDLVARMGGDEFVAILNDCGRENARRAIARVLQQIARMPLDALPAARAPQVTFSAGLLWVQSTATALDLDELIAATDRLMYQAKRAGGNRICPGDWPAPGH